MPFLAPIGLALGASAGTAAAVGTAATLGGAGLAASAYGAYKQGKDQKAADTTNRAAIEKQSQDQWTAYLMQRGINAPGTPTGTIPANGAPINTKLPLWATIQQSTPVGPPAKRNFF